MNRERMLQVLLSPHVSEKAALAADKAGQHVFRVAPDADKREIRKAVETLFDVKVRSVRVINAKGKRKLFGRSPGRRSDWKKAYVTLVEGQEIDLLGGAEP